MGHEPGPVGLMTEITKHLGGIFRHMLPGILVLTAVGLASPGLIFTSVGPKSWEHVLVLGAISAAAGNTLFAVNRYGLFQLLDYSLYLLKSDGPARGPHRFTYLDDLAKFVHRSMHAPESSQRARDHLAFRVSALLLILTVGELLLVCSIFHASGSLLTGNESLMRGTAVVLFAIVFWQTVIIRRIDHYIVNPPK